MAATRIWTPKLSCERGGGRIGRSEVRPKQGREAEEEEEEEEDTLSIDVDDEQDCVVGAYDRVDKI